MTLQGDLEVWRVTDVIRMLAATDKTGYLRVDGDERQGVVWFRDGSISAATTDRVPQGPLVEAMSDILRFCSGSFDFALDDRAPGIEAARTVDEVIQQAEVVLAEWDDLRADVPSLDCDVEMVTQMARPEVTVSARLWQAVAVAAEGCSVGGLASRLALTELGALRILHELIAAGLLTVGAPRSPVDAVPARLA